MRKTRTIATIGLAAVAALALSACNSGSPSGGSGDAGGGESQGSGDATELFTVAESVDLTGSPTYDAIVKRGKVKIGVKEDQPGLGFKDATTNTRTGFDVDIARWMAASLGFAEEDIEYTAIASANREQAIINGDIDYYVGTYSINDKRKESISFAGPYFITGQGLLVAADNEDIKSEKDLAGKKVCSATGSTPLQNIQTNFPEAKAEGLDLYSACVDGLIDGTYDVVTTDQAILIGYAAQDPDELKVVGEPFTTEKYGIGLAKDDAALQAFFNKTLTDGGDTWQKIFDFDLGASGMTVKQPAVE